MSFGSCGGDMTSIEEEVLKEVMNDDSWAYEIEMMDGYSSGEVESAVRKAIILTKSKMLDKVEKENDEFIKILKEAVMFNPHEYNAIPRNVIYKLIDRLAGEFKNRLKELKEERE